MRKISCAIASVGVIVLAGCAGGTSNPVFNTAAQKAYIYSASENSNRSTPEFGATGEVRYCGAGMPPLVQERKKNALAAAAQACGGENNYAITGESQTDNAPATLMGVAVQCTGFAGRIVYFKCKGAQPRPTGLTKKFSNPKRHKDENNTESDAAGHVERVRRDDRQRRST